MQRPDAPAAFLRVVEGPSRLRRHPDLRRAFGGDPARTPRLVSAVGSNPDYVPCPCVVQTVANVSAKLFFIAISIGLTGHPFRHNRLISYNIFLIFGSRAQFNVQMHLGVTTELSGLHGFAVRCVSYRLVSLHPEAIDLVRS